MNRVRRNAERRYTRRPQSVIFKLRQSDFSRRWAAGDNTDVLGIQLKRFERTPLIIRTRVQAIPFESEGWRRPRENVGPVVKQARRPKVPGIASCPRRNHLSSVHTYQAYSPIGLDLKLAKLPPKIPYCVKPIRSAAIPRGASGGPLRARSSGLRYSPIGLYA